MTEKDEVVFTEAFKELAAEGYFTRLEAKFMHKAKAKEVPAGEKNTRHHAPSVTVKAGKKNARRHAPTRNLIMKKHATLTDK